MMFAMDGASQTFFPTWTFSIILQKTFLNLEGWQETLREGERQRQKLERVREEEERESGSLDEI